MTNENPSRESASRQQSAERSQSGSPSSQQGMGTGMQRGGTQAGSFGQAGGGQESYGQGSGYGQGSYGQGQHGQGTQGSAWQGGRSGQSSGSALQRRGSSSMSPYSSGHEGHGTGPFSMMRRISDEMDRFFESFGLGGRSGFFPGHDRDWGEGQQSGANLPSMWSPHIEVFERNGKLVIQADLPGIKRDDVNVRIEQEAVIIQGQ